MNPFSPITGKGYVRIDSDNWTSTQLRKLSRAVYNTFDRIVYRGE